MSSDAVKCEQALALLGDYLKEELTIDVARRIEAHLNDCKDCFGQARFERRFLALLRERLSGAGCPGELRQRILTALRDESGAAEAGPH